MHQNMRCKHQSFVQEMGCSIPESATISFELRPLLLNKEMRSLRSSVAPGRLFSARLWLAEVESLLPSFTVHVGPPTWFCNNIQPSV